MALVPQQQIDSPAQKTSTRCDSPISLGADGQELLRQVVNYYHARLLENPAALQYLKERGIDQAEAIERFRIGFSDRTLGFRLPVKKVQAGAGIRGRLQQIGILRETGHEQFNGCVVFPVFAAQGNVCEIYGRKINDNLRNDTQYRLYMDAGCRGTETRGVWNHDQGATCKEILLCESIINALTFWCAGYRHVTASYGLDGFTDEHRAALERWGVRRVLIAYRRNELGDRAAESLAGEVLIPAGFECFRIQFPHGMDANEYARKITPATQSLDLAIRQAEWMGRGQDRVRSVPGAAAKLADTNQAADEPGQQPERMAADDGVRARGLCDVTPASASHAPTPLVVSPGLVAPRDVDAEVKNGQVDVTLGNRRYRVRGLGKNMSYDQLKVNILVSKGDAVHVDTFDLYNARSRASFVKLAATEVAVDVEVIKKDLGRVLLKLEELQDQQIAAALAPRDRACKLSDKDQDAALELLKDPNLLQRVATDFDACGVVGEETNKLVGYLAATSRKLDKPLAVMIQSSSSAGKTSLMDAVLRLMPPEEQIKYSAMTGQSLFYMGRTNLKHKILAISEEEGVEQAAYALKLLQSEGELRIASAGKSVDTGRLGTEDYHVEGPVMIFLTTTSDEPDFELVNRCLVLAVDEDRDQTRAIHRRQREGQTLRGLLATRQSQRIVKLHQDAQRLLRPLEVVNPYGEQLTFLDNKTRLRRDHLKYLTLIRSIALLHQYQRPVRTATCGDETIQYVEVTPHDIAVVNGLAAEVLGRTLDELSPQARRLLILLHDMVSQKCHELASERSAYRFTRRDVREAIGWSDYQVRVHLNKLVRLEYVLAHRGSRGQQFVYELLYDGQGREGQPFLLGLIDPARLSPHGIPQPAAEVGDEYDARSEGAGTNFEHTGEKDEPPTSVQSGLKEASLRPSNPLATLSVSASNGEDRGQPG
ncbi:MAG: toprim domain-containing protein [Planctomycetota bacterium]|nr:toprim domain-containing protein [Planctomycetota bacterium]